MSRRGDPRPRWRGWMQRGLIWAGSVMLVVLLGWSGLTARADAWLYDTQLAHQPEGPVDDGIVIVAIDGQSLEEIGRWPWPRRVHAALIDRLTAADVRGIALDVGMFDPDRTDPAGDALLAQAVARNGRVVMPVQAQPVRLGGVLQEMMPLPELSQAAAGLGHVAVAVDTDGVTRGVYLRAGLGSPHWPSLALALYRLDPSRRDSPLPGLRNPQAPPASPYLWVRDNYVLIPFAGPAGSFGRLSYVDVLHDRLPASMLRGRWVVIGATAAGMGDTLHAAVSNNAAGEPMPGVEYQANVLRMLQRGSGVTPLTAGQQWLLAGTLLLLPLMSRKKRYGLRSATAIVAGSVLLVLLVCLLLLRFGLLWFPPVALLCVILLGHVAWSVGHLRHWYRLGSRDALTGLANRYHFDHTMQEELLAGYRNGSPLSLMLIDVDYFKRFNDRHGHQAGDAALQQVARVLTRHARRSRDLAARYGGDEFALILPATTIADTRRIAAQIQASIRALPPQGISSEPVRISLSIGTRTQVPEVDTTAHDLLETADAALYEAKRNGRDGSVSV